MCRGLLLGNSAMKPADEQLKLLEQGVEKLYTPEELKKKLEKGAPLRVKLGADPTAPDLHLGHSVVLRKLRQFQDLGHKAVLIIGDYTALIGDPTGQNKTRPMLSAGDIERNATTYFEQVGKILDTAPDKLEIHRNSEWLGKMGMADVIRLASQMTVARMLERDTFEQRFEADVPIGVHEFLYPLMQGHDSVMIKADVELGGSDQTFNNLVGRDLQRDAGQEPQVVMILPILVGTDGVEKMSKSKDNYVALNDDPKEMRRKVINIKGDETVWQWFALLYGATEPDLSSLRTLDPMELREKLAYLLVEQFQGRDAALNAGLPESLPLRGRKFVLLIDLLFDSGRFSSKSELRRLFQQGAITVQGEQDKERVTDPTATISAAATPLLVHGRHLNYRVSVANEVIVASGDIKVGKKYTFHLEP